MKRIDRTPWIPTSRPSTRLAITTLALAGLALHAGCSGEVGSAKDATSFGSGPSPGPGLPDQTAPGGAGGAAGGASAPGVGPTPTPTATPTPVAPPGMGGTAPGGPSNVGVSGAQDFAVFRRSLDEGRIPAVETLDAAGFFAEHFTTLPPPTCGRAFCLHGMVSVSRDLARGGALTLLQLGMNSSIDPATVKRPPLNLAVVLDHSGSMAAAGKMDFAKDGVRQLIDALGPEDVFTLIVFDDHVDKLFGPAPVTDKAALEGIVSEIAPVGGTDIYDGLEAGYRAVTQSNADTQQRRVIFLTDGLPTAGITDLTSIRAMSLGYNQQYVGLTTIGLGGDVNVPLLRGLAETGGGNFYYIEKPEAVREVFMEELSFFVAPIAYDLELTFSELPGYALRNVYGTALWQSAPGGGKVSVPSVFLVSRTSSAPGPNGGRRGGGSAILAELGNTLIGPATGTQNLGRLSLRYRIPGQQGFETQEALVSYAPPPAPPGSAEVPEFFSSDAIEKNTLILDFFLALRGATIRAQTDPRAALELLTGFQARMTERLTGRTDEDLLDDLKIVGKYVDVLRSRAP
jgi:Ca-activated chloride channel family protein